MMTMNLVTAKKKKNDSTMTMAKGTVRTFRTATIETQIRPAKSTSLQHAGRHPRAGTDAVLTS